MKGVKNRIRKENPEKKSSEEDLFKEKGSPEGEASGNPAKKEEISSQGEVPATYTS